MDCPFCEKEMEFVREDTEEGLYEGYECDCGHTYCGE